MSRLYFWKAQGRFFVEEKIEVSVEVVDDMNLMVSSPTSLRLVFIRIQSLLFVRVYLAYGCVYYIAITENLDFFNIIFRKYTTVYILSFKCKSCGAMSCEAMSCEV